MTTPVYAWPPIAPTQWEWTLVEPMEVSRSLLTGKRYAAAGQRARRAARLSVGGIQEDFGAYNEALKRLLRGGANLVRLRNYPMTWDLIPREIRQSEPIRWTTGAEALAWQTGSEPLVWLTGAVLDGAATTAFDLPALTITGLPPSTLVGLPGEPITVWASAGSLDYATAQTRTLLRRVTSDENGEAVALLDSAVTNAGRVDLGFETAAFEAVELPRAQRGWSSQFFYDWNFVEVFADEVGGFQEIDPW